MQGDAKIIALLNQVLKAELTAINQYFLHAEMCENWGYERLAKLIRKESIEEMTHAEKLMERILYLDGAPKMTDYFKINIGQSVDQQFKNDVQLEYDAVKRLNDGIQLATEKTDAGSPRTARVDPRTTKSTTSTGSKANCTRSARWASRTTSRNS